MNYKFLLGIFAVVSLAAGCSQNGNTPDQVSALSDNDKFAILDIFKEKFPAFASTIKLDYTTSSPIYARGNIILDARGEQKGIFFAKNDAGEWGAMYFKNGEYFCADIQVLDLPEELVQDCKPSIPDLTTDDAKEIRRVLAESVKLDPEKLIVNIEVHDAEQASGYSTDESFNDKKYFTARKTGDTWQIDYYSITAPTSVEIN